MTVLQIEKKINELKFWLMNNPHHENYPIILMDKKELEQQLIHREYE